MKIRLASSCPHGLRAGLAALAISAIAIDMNLHAADEPPAAATRTTPAFSGLSYVRLYAGADGISHFADEQLQLVPAGGENIAANLLSVNRLGDVKGAMFAQLKAGSIETWHVAPRRQFMVCLRGIVEITAGDGQKRRMTPGQFMLLEDLTGQGHITQAVGSQDHVALAIPVTEGEPRVSAP